jgi:hypothetical protein
LVLRNYENHLTSLISRNKEKVNIANDLQIQASTVDRFYISDSRRDTAAINIYSFQREFFSQNETESTLANAMALTRGYYELLDQYNTNSTEQRRLEQTGLEQPASDDFQTTYASAKGIVTASIEQMREYSLETIRDINTKLQEFANNLAKDMPKSIKDSTKEDIDEEDLNTFQLVLRNAIETVGTLNHWATNWETDDKLKFDLNESWVQESMQKLGIQQKYITDSIQKLRNDADVKTIISSTAGNSANKVAYDCPEDKIVSTYESLVRASAPLEYIHSQLHEGFPVDSIPQVINGRERVYTSGTHMNCLLHSFLQLSTDWDNNKIERKGQKIRGKAIEKMSKKLEQLESSIPGDIDKQLEAASNAAKNDEGKFKEFNTLNEEWGPHIYERNTLREHIPAMKEGSMLELGGFEGQHIIDCLAEENVDGRRLIDRERGLLIYRYDEGRIKCVESELMPRSPEATLPPYVFFLQQDVHFEAMVEADKTR